MQPINNPPNPQAIGVEILGNISTHWSPPPFTGDTNFQCEINNRQFFALHWGSLGLDILRMPEIDFNTRRVFHIRQTYAEYTDYTLGLTNIAYNLSRGTIELHANPFITDMLPLIAGTQPSSPNPASLFVAAPNKIPVSITIKHEFLYVRDFDHELAKLTDKKIELFHQHHIDQTAVNNYDYDAGTGTNGELMKRAAEVFQKYNDCREKVQFPFCGANLKKFSIKARM